MDGARRRTIGGLAAALAMAGLCAGRRALAAAPRRVAVLAWSRESDRSTATMRKEIVTSMAELGHVEGRNIWFEWLYSNRDTARLHLLAAQVVRSRPDAVLTHLSETTQALAQVTTTIPIVAHVSDLVVDGFSVDGVMPSRNVTGTSDLWAERVTKLLEALKSIFPRLSRFGIVAGTRDPGIADYVALAERLSRLAGIEPQTYIVSSRTEVDEAFAAMPKKGIRAATTLDLWHLMPGRQQAELAIARGIALVSRAIGGGDGGELLHIAADFENPDPSLYHSPIRRQIAQLDKILRGVPVKEIPFEFPRRLRLTIDLRTAAALGLRIPQEVLLRADRIIQ